MDQSIKSGVLRINPPTWQWALQLQSFRWPGSSAGGRLLFLRVSHGCHSDQATPYMTGKRCFLKIGDPTITRLGGKDDDALMDFGGSPLLKNS